MRNDSRAARTAIVLAAALLMTGEAVRVDLGRRDLVVKVAGREPREIEFAVDEATRITAAGRTLLLEDVRPGDRVVVSGTAVEGGRRAARFVRVGTSRAAVPVTSPAPARP
jgi:hypothetical protein